MEDRYEEILEELYAQLPMFQRIGGAAYKVDLTNTTRLCALLGNPESHLKCVHIAGTNGKGSTSHLIASALQEQGYKVGLYTSPHLKDFRERIRINGAMIPKSEVVQFVESNRELWANLQPSFFEITVVMAFWYFHKEQTDIAVIETGMGGRLDSTNVITPEVSVITNIGFDHQKFLGETIEAIALEKAGIIKDNIPVVFGEMDPLALETMKKVASQRNAPFKLSDHHTLAPQSALLGDFQRQNERTAFLAIQTLNEQGWRISEGSILQGFSKVLENTGLKGRWQILNESPLTITDCGHNIDGWKVILKQLDKYQFGHLHVVLGMAEDKDVDAVLSILPKNALYYFTKANIPRAMDSDLLREKAEKFGLKGDDYNTVRKAYQAANIYAEKDDLIFIGGSVFVVAEVI